jgi:hypothetical protein
MNELNASMRLYGGPEVPSIVPAIASKKTPRLKPLANHKVDSACSNLKFARNLAAKTGKLQIRDIGPVQDVDS